MLAGFCGNSIQYYFHAPKIQTRLVLRMQELKLQKNAVWTLIALHCWEKLSECLFQRINSLKFGTDTCGAVNSKKYLFV